MGFGAGLPSWRRGTLEVVSPFPLPLWMARGGWGLCSLLAWCPEPGLVPDWGGLASGRPELPASHLPKGAWPHPVGLGRYILGVMEKSCAALSPVCRARATHTASCELRTIPCTHLGLWVLDEVLWPLLASFGQPLPRSSPTHIGEKDLPPQPTHSHTLSSFTQ